ncbi:MAG: hypothetical protein JETT_2061 [Candidatus Jettenia ecosi]|uniref:Uncharacterized protein n=1 Tax=Candidatus Jettenia ecosi TaxID=2494326 RepID=A0A533QM98_9BACT|nr:MAG: hypothetical protein JETT_2061 [Candidatus Jettenia ecosi]
MKDKNIEKNQKVTLEIKDGHIRLIPMRNTHLPPTNFKLPIMVEPSQTIIQNSVSHYGQSKESPVIHLSNYGKPVKNIDNITVTERKNVINNSFYLRLWNKIFAQLDIGIRNWQERIISFGQVTAVENREKGKRWTDHEIFEGIVKSVLSANTDWAKIERLLPELQSLFHDFAIDYYASLNKSDIENIIHPWFVVRRADSQSLKSNLIRLIETSKELIGYSQKYGCLDNFIHALLKESNSDPKLLALQLGSTGRRYKLSGMGIPIASEALRNIGFDIAKPDRHINRALGCFGMVKFKQWSESYVDSEGKIKERYVVTDNLEGYSRPKVDEGKCLEVMRTIEEFARAINIRPVFLDNAIWQLCAKSGLYIKNENLKKLAMFCC